VSGQRNHRKFRQHWWDETFLLRAQPVSIAKKTVLIVDDEHVIADTLAAIFSNAGYESRAAYSAEARSD
jgi:PleD family two-component response regulator